MRALSVTGVVGPDHTLTVRVPPDIAPGVHQVVVVLPDEAQASPRGPSLADRPAHPVGLANPALTFRREDIYGDDGR